MLLLEGLVGARPLAELILLKGQLRSVGGVWLRRLGAR